MRTTLTIDDHIMRELKDLAHRTGQPLKKVVHEALMAGLSQKRKRVPGKPYRSKTYSMGYPPKHDLDKALHIATVFEDDEISRKLILRK